MLVLSRKQQQEVLIGDHIKITVLKVKGNTVRLGIEAPPEVKVIRGELLRHESHPHMSNVTVVFSDPVERSAEVRSTDRGILKFDQSANETCSISFRQNMPEIFQRDRLKQIVESISRVRET